jgi:hypothetical protein
VTGAPSAFFAPDSASTVYRKISPRPVAIGPICGDSSAGSSPFTAWMRSATSWRAK